MAYISFKCPNCGSNFIINKINKTGKCEYCGHEVIYDLADDELSRLVESANAHIRLNDQRVLRKDCNLLYERYPGNPITYYYLAKADLLEVSHLIEDTTYVGRCNYLLSSAYVNLIRLREFNKENDVDPQEIIDEYNYYVNINNKNLKDLISKIKRSNAWNAIWISVLVIIPLALVFSSLLFLGILLIVIGLVDKWPQKLKRKFKKVPQLSMNKIFKY